jgi:hypothetical protein
MADYYPLIARAVAGLDKNNGEGRRALYDRARAALLAQLRGVTPALNESDITRERLALEESIRKVEAESAQKFVEPARQPPPPRIRPIEPRPAEDVEEHSPPPRRYVNAPPQPAQEVRPDFARRPRPPSSAPSKPTPSPPAQSKAATPEPRHSASVADEPAPSEMDAPQPRHPLRRLPAERRSLPDGGGKDLRNVGSDSADRGEASLRAEKSPREGLAPPPIAELDRAQRLRDRAQDRGQDRAQDHPRFDRSEGRMLEPQPQQEPMFEPQHEPQHEPHAYNDFSEPMLESSFPLDDAHPTAGRGRRPPPPPTEDAEFDRSSAKARAWSTWRPSRELVRGFAGAVAVLALLGFFAWQWPNMVEYYRAMRTPAVETTRDTPPSTTRPKITDRIEPGGQTSPAPTPGTQAGAAVAQKVVLYEEDPADPNGKRFVGSAIWRTETVTPGPGQPAELAIRADVEVPERKLTMSWSLRRNIDKTLPASHTVEIIFRLPTDFPSGGISNVPGILMKQAEQTRGVPLAGLAVKVTNGFFLIGLSSVEADKERNLQLLKDRAWFDIPVVYNNNRRAILAMEKGTPGDRAFAEAFKVWKQ